MKTALLVILGSTLAGLKGFKGRIYQNLFAQQNAPTGKEIVRILLQNRITRQRLEKAWLGSHYEKDIYRERGGFIFANPNSPRQLQVVLAPKNVAETFKLNGRENSQGNPAIDLKGAGSANATKNWILVANFHTHPLLVNQEPSTADLRNAFRRGVPGIVISRLNIWVYGPENREDFEPVGNPRAYPEDNDMSNFNPLARNSVKDVVQNPFSPPLP